MQDMGFEKILKRLIWRDIRELVALFVVCAYALYNSNFLYFKPLLIALLIPATLLALNFKKALKVKSQVLDRKQRGNFIVRESQFLSLAWAWYVIPIMGPFMIDTIFFRPNGISFVSLAVLIAISFLVAFINIKASKSLMYEFNF